MDFIRTDIDRELDESSLTPHQQVFEKMISGRKIFKRKINKYDRLLLALYLGEIVRLIIVDLVQRSILFPGRMQKSPSIRPDYNIFLILRGKRTKYANGIFYRNVVFSLKEVSMQNMWPILKMIQVKQKELKE